MDAYPMQRKKEERRKTYASIVENQDTKQTIVLQRDSSKTRPDQDINTETDQEDLEEMNIAEPITIKQHPQPPPFPIMQEAKNPRC